MRQCLLNHEKPSKSATRIQNVALGAGEALDGGFVYPAPRCASAA
jgi:hypothetical protein